MQEGEGGARTFKDFGIDLKGRVPEKITVGMKLGPASSQVPPQTATSALDELAALKARVAVLEGRAPAEASGGKMQASENYATRGGGVGFSFSMSGGQTDGG